MLNCALGVLCIIVSIVGNLFLLGAVDYSEEVHMGTHDFGCFIVILTNLATIGSVLFLLK